MCSILLQDNFVMSLKYVFHSSQSFSKTTLLCHSRMCSIQANPSPRQLCYVTQGCVPFKPILLHVNFVMSLIDVFHSSPRQLCYVTQICVPFKPILLQDNFVMSLKDVFHSSQSFSKTTLLCHSRMCSIQANPSPCQLCYVTHRCVPFFSKTTLLCHSNMCSIQANPSPRPCHSRMCSIQTKPSPRQLCYVTQGCVPFKPNLLQDNFVMSLKYVFHSSQSSPRQLCYVTQICVPFKPMLLQDNFVMSLKYVFHSSQSFSKTTLLCHSNMCSIQTNPSPRQLCYVTQICVPFKPILLQDNFVMSLKYVFHSSQSFSKTTLLCHSNMCSIQANPSPRQLCYVTQGCVPFKTNSNMCSFSKTTLLCHSRMCSIQANPSPCQLCYVTHRCVPFFFSKTTLLCHSNMCSIQANPSPRQLCYVTQICVPFKPILLQDNFVMSLKYVFHSNHFFSMTTLLCHSRMCSILTISSP